MQKRMFKAFILIIILLQIKISAQEITGWVYSSSGVSLPNASVIIKELNKGAHTDNNGFFELKNISEGKYTLEISYVGHKKKSISVSPSFPAAPIKIIIYEETITTNQVIVSAAKKEENITELPVTVAAIRPEELESKNRLSLDEALRYVPGVQMSLDQISIRGSSGYSKGAGTRVLTAIDGVPFYTGDTGEIIWEMIPISNIDRVEIIKGPASSLYGSTAIGGVINVITKEIYNKPITQISTYAGFYSSPYHSEWRWSNKTRTFFGAGINHSNSIGKFGYSISLKKTGNDGYRENDFSKRNFGFIKLNYKADSLNSITLSASYLNMHRGNFLYWKDAANALSPKDEDNGKTVKSDRWFGSLIYKHNFNDFISGELKSSIYNTKFEGIGVEVTSSRSSLLRAEYLLHIKLNDAFSLITGTEFSYSSISSDIFNSKDFKTLAGYSQIEYRGIDKLIASFGIRYDYIKLDSLSGAQALSPKIGINYKINDAVILRSSAGAGFRAPTPAEVFTATTAGSIPIKENPDLTYEKSFSLDAGILINPGKIFSLDISVFYNHYNNFIEPALLKSGYIQFVNLSEAKTEGFEILNENFFFGGLIKTSIGYTYLWSWDYENDSPMKYRPRNTVYSSISFFPSPFEFSIDFRYMDKAERIDDDLTRVPLTLVEDGEKRVNVYVVDLSAGFIFTINRIITKVHFNCKNLFNYNYVEFIGNVAPIRSYSLSADFYF